jgi:uncharacterized protein (TIRG00374 family)
MPRRPAYWLFAFPLAAAALYFSLRGVDWLRVREIASTANVALLALNCAVTTLSFLVRAVRWRVLLRAAGDVSFGTVFWSMCSGYMANSFLPARTGEILRAALVSARSGLSKTYSLTTALAERVADALTLIGASAIVLLTISRKPEWLAVAARPIAAIAFTGVIILIGLPRLKPLIDTILVRLPLPEKLRHRLAQAMEQILLGIRTLHHGARLAGFSALTAAVWFLDAAGAVILARALRLDFGFGAALLLLTAIGLSSALPATPGSVGVFQFVTVIVLAPFGVTHTDAVAYALILQALTYLVVAFWGLMAVWRCRR